MPDKRRRVRFEGNDRPNHEPRTARTDVLLRVEVLIMAGAPFQGIRKYSRFWRAGGSRFAPSPHTGQPAKPPAPWMCPRPGFVFVWREIRSVGIPTCIKNTKVCIHLPVTSHLDWLPPSCRVYIINWMRRKWDSPHADGARPRLTERLKDGLAREFPIEQCLRMRLAHHEASVSSRPSR